MSPQIRPSDIRTTAGVPLPTEILTASSATMSPAATSQSPSATNAVASPSASASTIANPPVIAGITIGSIAVAIILVFIFGTIIDWHVQRRRAAARNQHLFEDNYRWNASSDEAAHGASISAPIDQQDIKPPNVYSGPALLKDPNAGIRLDPATIGLAVSPESNNDDEFHNDAASVSSTAHLIMPSAKYKAYNGPVVRAPSRQQRRDTVFEEDDPSTADESALSGHEPQHDRYSSRQERRGTVFEEDEPTDLPSQSQQDRPSYSQPREGFRHAGLTIGGPQLIRPSHNQPSHDQSEGSEPLANGPLVDRSNSQTYRSALRPRGANPPLRTTSRQALPSLQTSLNKIGVPQIKVRPPTVMESIIPEEASLQVTSNAHAQTTPDPKELSPLEPPTKHLSIEASYPSYVFDYYTSNSPRTPVIMGHSRAASREPSLNAVAPHTPTISNQTIPHTTVSEEVIPQTSIQDQALPQTSISKETIPQTSTSNGTIPQTTIPSRPTAVAKSTSISKGRGKELSPTSPASSDTSFESLDSLDITPPFDIRLSPYTSPISSPTSPLHGLTYPKIPRPAAQLVPRTPTTPPSTYPRPTAPPPSGPLPNLPHSSAHSHPRRRPVSIRTSSASKVPGQGVVSATLSSARSTGSQPSPAGATWGAACKEMSMRSPQPWGGIGVAVTCSAPVVLGAGFRS